MTDLLAWIAIASISAILVLLIGVLVRRRRRARRDRERAAVMEQIYRRDRENGSALVELLAIVASLILLGVGCAFQIERLRFSSGYVANVKPDGRFEWRRQPLHPDRGEDPPGVLRGRLWCTNGMVAASTSYRSVACVRPR